MDQRGRTPQAATRDPWLTDNLHFNNGIVNKHKEELVSPSVEVDPPIRHFLQSTSSQSSIGQPKILQPSILSAGSRTTSSNFELDPDLATFDPVVMGSATGAGQPASANSRRLTAGSETQAGPGSMSSSTTTNRPESVITTTSSLANSEQPEIEELVVIGSGPEGSSLHEEEDEEEAGSSHSLSGESLNNHPAMGANLPPNVYTISGLYGPPSNSSATGTPTDSGCSANDLRYDELPSSLSVGCGGSARAAAKTHKRSTSNTAPSIVKNNIQNMTQHKRSHSHTVGYNNQHANGYTTASNPAQQVLSHRRSGSSGFAMGHRRTASGALIEVLDKFTGGSVLDTATDCVPSTTTEYLQNLQRQNLERRESRRESLAASLAASKIDEEDEGLNELNDCGYMGCKPAWARPLASIKVFVFLLSLLVVLQQALSSGYLNSVITTIEKRFEIPSSISGVIASMYEIGNVFTVIFVSYLGTRRHIPMFIGTGVIVMGLGSVIFSIPHFISESYTSSLNVDANRSSENICLQDPLAGESSLMTMSSRKLSEDTCSGKANWDSSYSIYIFMLAQLLLGCSGSPIFTLGTTYIDDHVRRDTASVYLGCIYSMVAFGPVLGFLLGAALLSKYVDELTEDISHLNIDSDNRHWVGMWWGGFLICGILILIISIPFFSFPKEMKREKRRVFLHEKMQQQQQEATASAAANASSESTTSVSNGKTVEHDTTKEQDQVDVKTYGQNLKDLPMCIWRLLTNWVYMATCLGSCAELVIVSGFVVFLPKYLETQFSLSKSDSNLLTGGTAIPGACIGILLGGYILKRFQMKPKGAIQLVILLNFICICCYGLLFTFGCDNWKMAGATSPYVLTEETRDANWTEHFQVNLTASCNSDCTCDTNDVQPVCGANGLTYFSPCHAGCTSALFSGANFTDCKCVLDGFTETDETDGVSMPPGVSRVPVATAGPCFTECKMLWPFIVLLFFMTLMVAITQMPLVMVTLRSVADEEKSFALGIQFVIFRLFGYIPSPIMFGSVIDSTCLLWKQTCGGSAGGRCLVYDIVSFRYKYVGICAGIKGLAFFIFLLDWWLIRLKDKAEESLEEDRAKKDQMSLDESGPNGVVVLGRYASKDDAGGLHGIVNAGSDLEEAEWNAALAEKKLADAVGSGSSMISPSSDILSPTRQPMIGQPTNGSERSYLP